MQNRRIIGITGGIGSGKSRVLKILETDYQALVLQTDVIAKDLQVPGKPGYDAIRQLIGSDILCPNGEIDRAKLAALLFADPALLAQVNQVIHPLVWDAVKNEIAAAKAPLIAVESALFSEKSGDFCDELWYVYTSRENRLRRLMQTRGYSQEKALAIMAQQPTAARFYELADHRIENNSSIEALKEQIRLRLSSLR